MTSFFDGVEAPPAPAEDPIEYRVPPWLGPPSNVLPGSVGLDVLLARTPDAAAWLGDLRAMPDGVQLALTIALRRPRGGRDEDDSPLWGREPATLGVAFSDGRKAIMSRGSSPLEEAVGDPATDIVLYAGSGQGSPGRATANVWLWPLPPEGPLTFVVRWPGGGIAETAVAVDAAPFRAAAQRAVVLWDDERPLLPADPARRRGSWSTSS